MRWQHQSRSEERKWKVKLHFTNQDSDHAVSKVRQKIWLQPWMHHKWDQAAIQTPTRTVASGSRWKVRSKALLWYKQVYSYWYSYIGPKGSVTVKIVSFKLSYTYTMYLFLFFLTLDWHMPWLCQRRPRLESCCFQKDCRSWPRSSIYYLVFLSFQDFPPINNISLPFHSVLLYPIIALLY